MEFADVVGLVSGLIAIFTFLTGVTSARELRRPAAVPVSEPRRLRLRLVLWLSVPGFVVSMAVTLSQGLAGSDTGGTQFLLLLAGALLLVLYATAFRGSMSWPGFLVTCIVALGGLGFLMGSISRGEEAEGVTAGLVIGAGVGLLGLAFRSGPPGAGPVRGAPLPDPPAPHDRTDQERAVLLLAQRRGGEVCVGDVALHTSLSLDDGRDVLDQLAARGFCERHVLPGGAVVYHFPDLRSR